MSPSTSTICAQVSNPALEWVRYFPRQLITADDMRAEQDYFREKLRRHNRMLHGWGVVCGCEVVAKNNWQVTVSAGYLITPAGDEICIPEDITFDLAQDSPKAYDPCPQPTPCSPAGGAKAVAGNTVYLAVCYSECNTRPVRTHPAGCGCGCDDSACEYSRARESYELVCLDELPESYGTTMQNEDEWMKIASAADDAGKRSIPDCSPWTDDCCVVLAQVKLPTKQSDQITLENIFLTRRPLFKG